MTIDFDALQATSDLSIPLAANQRVRRAEVISAPLTGFDALDSCEVVVDVWDVRGQASPTLEVVVEGSTDGVSWAEVDGCSWTFTANGRQQVSVDAPPARLRARLTPGGGLREAIVGSIMVTPSTINKPGGGDGSGGSSSDVYVNIAVGITGLQDESGADFQWNVSRLRPGNNYSVMTAVIGPMTAGAGAGGYVTINGPALSDLNGQTLTLTYGEIRVSNAAGTEKLIASTAAPTAFTTDHQVLHVLVDDGFIIEQVGSDLSVDSNGYIVSAVGGQFFVSGLVQARLT